MMFSLPSGVYHTVHTSGERVRVRGKELQKAKCKIAVENSK
jgi:hypothetical protein